MQKVEMLTLLDDKIKVCTKCPELVENRTNTVLGSGNPNAKVVFCGEAPGKDEDKSGEAFVGQAGKLLSSILEACGLNRHEDVYIMNVVKCRPPNNRVPTKTECQNCRPFFDLQLKVINPEYIVCLGTVAAQNLLITEERISDLRGRWFSYKEAKVICTFHPSYALRRKYAKKEIWNDLQPLLKLIRSH
jgi:DNA polymerase